MNTEQALQRFNQTLAKIEGFNSYESGWDFGRGKPIEKRAIGIASEIVRQAFGRGIWKSSAFPTPSGQVLLAFPISKDLDIEIYINQDQTFDFTCEKNGNEIESREDLTLEETISLLNLYGNESIIEKCLSESLITASITTSSPEGFEAQHLNRRPTGAYLYSMNNAPKIILQAFANTSQNTIQKEYPAIPPTTGNWPRLFQIPPFTAKELNMIRAT